MYSNSFSQWKHTVNLEYTIGNYLDKYPTKMYLELTIPPSINYQIMEKNNGLELFIKKISVDYQEDFYNRETKRFPDTIALSRNTFYAGINYIRNVHMIANLNLRPFVGLCYMRAGDAMHYGYYPSPGWNEPYGRSVLNKNKVAVSFGAKVNYELFKRINVYVGLSHFHSFNNNIQKNVLTTDLGIGYVFTTKKIK